MPSILIAFGADKVSESIATSRYCDKLVVVMNIADILEDLAEVLRADQKF